MCLGVGFSVTPRQDKHLFPINLVEVPAMANARLIEHSNVKRVLTVTIGEIQNEEQISLPIIQREEMDSI